MAAATYSVSVTTLVGANQLPDLNQVYGVWHSNGAAVPWPGTVTSLSISNLPPITSITTITKELWGEGTKVTATATFGELRSGTVPVTWPGNSIGLVAGSTIGPISTPPSFTSSAHPTATTPGTPVTAGTTTTTATNTSVSTRKLPTSTASPSPAVSSPSPGISTGATAGIAVACALVGLAIGLLAAFCLFRRKGRRNRSVDNVPVLRQEYEAYPSDKATPPVSDIQLGRFLLEPTPDRDIAQETQSIGALIDQHVESYYHTHPVTADARALASVLTQLGFPATTNSALLDAQGATALCLDPRSRHVGLRHVIMRVLFSSIDVNSPHGLSMLPAPVASFLRAIPPAESDRFGDPQANALALRKWRELSAFLLHPGRSQRTSLPIGDAAVAMQAAELASSLNAFLRFFVDQQQLQQQVGHLQAVIGECAKLGHMLFSHPCDWQFIYEAGAAANRGIIVEAGLCKLGSQDGAPNPSPQRLVEPVVVSP